MGVAEKLDDAIARCAGRGVPDLRIALEESRAEIERLQAAKRGALAIADERSRENVELRAALATLVNGWGPLGPKEYDQAVAKARGLSLRVDEQDVGDPCDGPPQGTLRCGQRLPKR